MSSSNFSLETERSKELSAKIFKASIPLIYLREDSHFSVADETRVLKTLKLLLAQDPSNLSRLLSHELQANVRSF